MPDIRKIITCCSLLYLSHCFFNTAAAQNFSFTEEKTYYTNKGNEITNLTFRVEQKSPDEYVLTIENRRNTPNTEIWIFHKEIKPNKGKLPEYPSYEVEGLERIQPFCKGNKTNIPLAETKNIRYREDLPLSGDLSAGETVTLNMFFYIATTIKKKTVINDFAKIPLTFTLPAPKKTEAPQEPKAPKAPKNEKASTTLYPDTDLSLPPPDELTPEEKEAWLERKTDSLLQVKISELDDYISDKNTEMKALLAEINELGTQNKQIEDAIISPVANKVKILQKDVDFLENHYKSAIAENAILRSNFSEFSVMCEEAMKKIEILRQEPPAPTPINWLLYLGIGLGALFLLVGMVAMPIWNQYKIKRQQRQQQEEINRDMRRRELEYIDEPLEDI